VIYCRISLATHGDRTKVTRQEKLCRRLAKRLGWEVVTVYCDNNKSAWQRNRKRDDWDAMLAAIERGEADAVIVYHGDRLIRQPWDLETLLTLADGRGIRLASPSGTRDLDDADHRYQLRLDVAAACRESDRISKRTQDAHADRAERGVMKKGGMRPFGYKRSGKIREEEAEHYRAAVARMLAGESMRTIVHDWNTQGVLTSQGNPWSVGTLRLVLRNPRYAGLSSYKGEIVGVGKWKPVVDRETWEALQARLGAIRERYGRPNHTSTSKYLLTYIAFHAECGSTMQMHHSGQGIGVGYICSDSHCPARVRRNMSHVDEYVIGAVLGRLADPRVWAALEAPEPQDNAAAELAALDQKRRDTEAVFERSLTMTPERLEKLLLRLDGQIDAIRDRIASRGNVHVLAGCRDLTRAQWDALPLDRRRALVRALVTVEILRGRKGRYFDPDSVQVLPVEIRRAEGTGGSGEGPSAAG
jgi:DNA invertase Pin-like site-specific DNA recombinase